MNYHVLDTADDQKTINVVYHIPLDSTLNQAAITYRQAYLEYLSFQGKNTTSVLTGKTSFDISGEQVQLDTGTLVEYFETYNFSILGLTLVQKRIELDNRFNFLIIKIPDKIKTILDFWGFDRNVT